MSWMQAKAIEGNPYPPIEINVSSPYITIKKKIILHIFSNAVPNLFNTI